MSKHLTQKPSGGCFYGSPHHYALNLLASNFGTVTLVHSLDAEGIVSHDTIGASTMAVRLSVASRHIFLSARTVSIPANWGSGTRRRLWASCLSCPHVNCGKERSSLNAHCWQVVVKPNETLFETGDDSSSGIFIVLEGAVGVYMHDGDKLMHTNTLRPGESVGDVDILDGRPHGFELVLPDMCATHSTH